VAVRKLYYIFDTRRSEVNRYIRRPDYDTLKNMLRHLGCVPKLTASAKNL